MHAFDGRLTFSDLKYVDVDKETAEKYRLKSGDILFNRTNSRDLVGKTAVFRQDEHYLFVSYIIRVQVACMHQFIIDYAPYFYYIPGSGVDPEFGRGVAPAAFAIDFLYEAYQDEQFESKKTEIYNKIVSLADFILTQQCSDPAKKAACI